MNANIPDVHVFDRDIPRGKVLLAEYRDIGGERRVESVLLDVKTGWGRVEVRLVARHAGWNIAGSMARWDNGSYGVVWEVSGATHGSRYRTFDEALAHFQRIPERDPYEAAA